MPQYRFGGTGQQYPTSALLMSPEDAEGPSIWAQFLHGLGTAVEAPQRVVQALSVGELPYTEAAPKTTEEWLLRLGFDPKRGGHISEAEARIAKGVIWGLMGAATGGGMLGAALFGGLAQIGDVPETTGGLVETAADLGTDPLMYAHAGKLSGGGRAPLPEIAAFGRGGVGQVFTKAGTKQFRTLHKSVYESMYAPLVEAGEHTWDDAVEMAARDAAHSLVTAHGNIAGAVKAGVLQRGGIYFLLPGTGLRATIPGSERFNAAVTSFFDKLAPESLKKAFGRYAPPMRDVRMKYHAKARSGFQKQVDAIAGLSDELQKMDLPEEWVTRIAPVMSSEGAYGFRQAVRKYIPEIDSAAGSGLPREPWQMTRAEFESSVKLERRLASKMGKLGEEAGKDIDWAPLRLVIPEKQRDAFMYMGRAPGNPEIRMYKHGITRRSIHLDSEGIAYQYLGKDQFRAIRLDRALDRVYEDIEDLAGIGGKAATKETPYSPEYLRERAAYLESQGIKTLRATPHGVEASGKALTHESFIRQAIKEGRLIPEDVIRSYPALAKAHPGSIAPKGVRLPADALERVKKAADAVDDAFSTARKAGLKAGLDIPQMNVDALEHHLTRKLVAKSMIAKGSADEILSAAQKEAASIDKELAKLRPERERLVRHIEDFLQDATKGVMKEAQDILRRGGTAEEAAAALREGAQAQKVDLPAKLAQREARLAEIDAEMKTLTAQKEGYTAETTFWTGQVAKDRDMAVEKLTKEIEALQLEKKASGRYFPTLFDPEARKIIQDLAEKPDELRKLLDEDIPAFFGQKTAKILHGSGIVEERSVAEQARALVEGEVYREQRRMFSPGHKVHGAPQEKQKALRVGIKAGEPLSPEQIEEALEQGIPIKQGWRVKAAGEDTIERALRYDEMQEAAEGLSYMLGKKIARGTISRIIRGEHPSVRQTGKLKPAAGFANDPLTALAAYYRGMGHPIAMKEAMTDVTRRFGRVLSPKQVAEGAHIPGMRRMSDIPGMERTALPFDIAQEFERWVRDVDNPKTLVRFLAPYAAAIQYIKQMAVAWPAFHSRNAQSGFWQMIVAGTLRNPWSVVEALQMMFRKGRMGLWGKDGKIALQRGLHGSRRVHLPFGSFGLDELDDGFRHLGGDGSTFFQFESGLPGMTGPRAITRIDRAIFNANMKSGNWVEKLLRRTQWVDAMKQGYSPYEAFKQTARTHFLYDSLSATEARIFRPYLWPFYAWGRFNIPYTLEHIARRPGLYREAQKWIEDLRHDEGAPEYESLKPDWIRRMMGVYVGKGPDGEDRYFLLGNFWPYSDVDEILTSPVQKLISDINPVIGLAATEATGRVPGMGWRAERFPGAQTEFMGLPMSEKWANRLRTFRWANEAHRLIGTIPPAVAKGDKSDVTLYLLHALMGHKVYTYDRERMAAATIFTNRMEIRKMRGVYSRSALAGDVPNMNASAKWLVDRGIAIPTWPEVIAHRDQSLRESKRMSRLVESVLRE